MSEEIGLILSLLTEAAIEHCALRHLTDFNVMKKKKKLCEYQNRLI